LLHPKPANALPFARRNNPLPDASGAPAAVAEPRTQPAIDRILIVSDAWKPQVNGVVRTLSTLVQELAALGREAVVIGPDRFTTLPCPTYPDIRLSLLPRRRLARLIDEFQPHALHIATEGPLGTAARGLARARGERFTTAFHTRFPEYLQARTGLPTGLSYAWMRRFHSAGEGVMVAADTMRRELAARGFKNIRPWSRGVDLTVFHPRPRTPNATPRFLYVGRVAVEKNITAFLDLDLPGEKVVVGDGPLLGRLRAAYPAVEFTGARFGADLADAYAAADVLVFPSLTDTFGLVMVEALACGTPVAGFPVTGPLDVLADAPVSVGSLNTDLRQAALEALGADRDACRRYAERFSWRACAESFLGHLVPRI
jgi:glycosyltransferase involved in cell wall biosynthesis